MVSELLWGTVQRDRFQLVQRVDHLTRFLRLSESALQECPIQKKKKRKTQGQSEISVSDEAALEPVKGK